MSDQNPLDVSDEDFLNMEVPPEVVEEVAETEEVLDKQEEIEETSNEQVEDIEDVVENSESNTTEEEETSEEVSNTQGQDTFSDDNSAFEEDSSNNEDTETTNTETSIDYKAEYSKLLSSFKANGKDMSIANVDDARTLMMMGANYNKKMAGLKPHLKMVKMLENNDLLDESKLNFLIDLSKKNPDAIKKLVGDSDIDPMDIDTDEESAYTPQDHAVSDKEVELDAVLDEIRGSTKFQDTIDVISNQWDDGSKQIILETPAVIKIINEHMEAGIYDQITSVVESERVLGRLNGLSDIEAYQKIGDAIHARGGFGNQSQNRQNQSNTTNQQTIRDPKLAAKKKAASSTKSTSSNKAIPKGFNPLNMSDEDFEKMSTDKFL